MYGKVTRFITKKKHCRKPLQTLEKKNPSRIQHFKTPILLSKVTLNIHKAINPVIFLFTKIIYRILRNDSLTYEIEIVFIIFIITF